MDKEKCGRPEKLETDYFKFFSHTKCEFFPCHDVSDENGFNCLFCYCPLYALGEKCGGDFEYLENGVKSCSNCTVPHRKDAYEVIISKCSELVDLARVVVDTEK